MTLKDKEKGLRKVQPVKHVPSQDTDKTYEYKYIFEEIDTETIRKEGIVDLPKGADVDIGDEYIKWKYEGRPTIFIGELNCYRRVGSDKNKAEENCFRALSVLESKGYVSFWRQKP